MVYTNFSMIIFWYAHDPFGRSQPAACGRASSTSVPLREDSGTPALGLDTPACYRLYIWGPTHNVPARFTGRGYGPATGVVLNQFFMLRTDLGKQPYVMSLLSSTLTSTQTVR